MRDEVSPTEQLLAFLPIKEFEFAAPRISAQLVGRGKRCARTRKPSPSTDANYRTERGHHGVSMNFERRALAWTGGRQ